MDGRPDLLRRAAAEGLRVSTLVFAGCGAIIAEAEHPGTLGSRDRPGLRPGRDGDGLRHRASVRSAPEPAAVTLAFVLTRHMPRGEALAVRDGAAPRRAGRRRCPLRGLAHAARLARGDGPLPSRSAAPSRTRVVVSAFLMFVIMAVATDVRAVGAAAAIAIGATVGLDALLEGPITKPR